MKSILLSARRAARPLRLCLFALAVGAAAFASASRADEPDASDESDAPIASDESADSSDRAPESPSPDADLPTLSPVLVTAPRTEESPPGAETIDESGLAGARATSADSTRLLDGVAGVNRYGAGGASSLPAIRGLADERVKITVDGAQPMAACPNHMNPALSTIAPSKVGSITVFRGISPVSAGGDSIGGTIRVESAPPAFSEASDEVLLSGGGGANFRSNGNAYGYQANGTVATDQLHLSYQESNANSDDYTAGKAFKPGAIGSLLPQGEYLDGDVVGSSRYRNLHNRSATLAGRLGTHLVSVSAGLQQVGFQGFPNQRMDMTANENQTLGFRYTGEWGFGSVDAAWYGQNTRHEMDMGPDRFFYGYGMPMDADARTRGGRIRVDFPIFESDVLRFGSEYQTYDLDDWWPPVGNKGVMAPDTFWNIRDGVRDRIGLFGEWEARWGSQWWTLVGVRGESVVTNAGPVQGYNDKLGIWGKDAAAFNALDRRERDTNLDWNALVRWMPLGFLTLEAGFARQTRSPSLYERYPWSTNAMAALMNNFVGDGNGYIGDVDLRAEVAHTAVATIDLHDPDGDDWGIEATAYRTRIGDYIDARRCDFGQCSRQNVTRTEGFVLLQYTNQSAELWGVDVSAHALVGELDPFGSLTATFLLGWVRGENRITDDDLFQIMPLNGTLGLVHRIGPWTTAAEYQVVASKTRVSQVRNEIPTGSYSLLNLRASWEWRAIRVDLAVENVLDRFYSLPLGGAYLGQGASMSTATIPWGVAVPGMGRSYNVAVTLEF